jgi:ethanolamine utilization protein EutA (predicted chaperonin)
LFVAEQLQKNCAHGKFARSRSSAAAGGGQRPTAGTDLSTVIAGHGASLRAFTPVFDGLWTRVNALATRRGQSPRVLE